MGSISPRHRPRSHARREPAARSAAPSQRLHRARGIVMLGVIWLVTAGFSAPIEALRDEIRVLKTEQASVAQREDNLMAKQDDLTRSIKRLKSESRGPSVPFGPRRIEEAFTRLRTTVRDEILQIVSGISEDTDARDRAEIRALLALYPPSPAPPALPPGSEPTAIILPTDPQTLTEQTLLLRDQRERHEVVRRRAESVHNLLTEELMLYRTLAERELGFEPHWQTLDRQVVEVGALIEALNERMFRMDETLRQLDILVSQPVTGP